LGKILFISYDGMTDHLGQSQVIPYLEKLQNLGHQIFILSCEKKENFLINQELIKSQLTVAGITWVPILYHKSPPIISTLYDLNKILKTASEICENEKIQIIHCRSYIPMLAGIKLKKKHGCKLIFDMRGFWADERIDGKIWNLKNPVYNLIYSYFKKKEHQFLQESDYTISLTQNAKSEILKWQLNNQINIEVIPCCADTTHFKKDDLHSNAKNTIGSERELTISYLGSTGTWYMLDEMLFFFEALLKKYTCAKFLFITGDNPSIILNKATELKIPLENIIIKKATRNQVPSLIQQSDISVFFIKPLYSKKASSPTKLAELMSMGIPVICNSGVGDIDEIINKTGCGLVVSDFSQEAFLNIIDKIDFLLNIDKNIIRGNAEKYFSLESGVEKYNRIYQSLINN